jgi:hypothetical protein
MHRVPFAVAYYASEKYINHPFLRLNLIPYIAQSIELSKSKNKRKRAVCALAGSAEASIEKGRSTRTASLLSMNGDKQHRRIVVPMNI